MFGMDDIVDADADATGAEVAIVAADDVSTMR